MNITDYEIKGTTICECGHEFTIKDFQELNRIEEHGFYSNQIKHYSPAICPKCKKGIILLLKQKGQTYVVADTAIKKEQQSDKKDVEATIENEEQKEISQEFICPECKKVCKSKSGLMAHIKTHNN